jgi:predicted deacylase
MFKSYLHSKATFLKKLCIFISKHLSTCPLQKSHAPLGSRPAASSPSIITQCGLGFKTQAEEDFINFHIQAVNNNMKHFGMLGGEKVMHPKQREFTVGFDQLRAKSGGIFQGIADQGDILKKGELIGRVTSLDGSVLEELHSPIDGVVHELLVRRVVSQGDLLYNLVQFKS